MILGVFFSVAGPSQLACGTGIVEALLAGKPVPKDNMHIPNVNACVKNTDQDLDSVCVEPLQVNRCLPPNPEEGVASLKWTRSSIGKPKLRCCPLHASESDHVARRLFKRLTSDCLAPAPGAENARRSRSPSTSSQTERFAGDVVRFWPHLYNPHAN